MTGMFHTWERRRLHTALGRGRKKENAQLKKKLGVDGKIIFKCNFKNKIA